MFTVSVAQPISRTADLMKLMVLCALGFGNDACRDFGGVGFCPSRIIRSGGGGGGLGYLGISLIICVLVVYVVELLDREI